MPESLDSANEPLFSRDALISLTALKPLAERLMAQAPGSAEANLGCCLAAVFTAVGQTLSKRDPRIMAGLTDAITRYTEGRP